MIQRFKMHGQFSDANTLQVKENAIHVLTVQMKEQGFIPVLDLNITWQTMMVDDHFEYDLVMQGVFIGIEDAWHYLGVTNGKPTPSSPTTK